MGQAWFTGVGLVFGSALKLGAHIIFLPQLGSYLSLCWAPQAWGSSNGSNVKLSFLPS